MSAKRSRGYLYVAGPTEGPPVLVAVQEYGDMAVPVAVRGDDSRQPGKAAAVASAADAPPGLYLARAVVAGTTFRVVRGPKVGDVVTEIHRQVSRANRRSARPFRYRAMARALLTHILPVVAGCGSVII